MWLRCGSNCKVGRKHHYEVTASTAWPGSQLLSNNTMNQDWASAEGAVRAQPPLHHCLRRWFLYIYCAADRSWTRPLVPRHNHACRKFTALVCQWGRQRLELLLHSWRAWFMAKSGDFSCGILYHVCTSVTLNAPAPKRSLRTRKVKTQLVPLIGRQEWMPVFGCLSLRWTLGEQEKGFAKLMGRSHFYTQILQ